MANQRHRSLVETKPCGWLRPGPNWTHSPWIRCDKHPASIETTHSKQPFQRKSSCLQGFDKWPTREGTSGDGCVLGFSPATTLRRAIATSDLWGLWANQKCFIPAVAPSVGLSDTPCGTALRPWMKAAASRAPEHWLGCDSASKTNHETESQHLTVYKPLPSD